jgi:hypothetical protein
VVAVDYSFARPSVEALKAADVVAVGRYLSGPGKAVSGPEVASYDQAGIVTWFVMENSANDASSGHNGGLLAASMSSFALAAVIGSAAAAVQPRYFAVDEAVDPSLVVGYFVGISRVIDPSLVGVYGDGVICNYLGATGLASWFWQSSSSSYPGNQTTIPAAHIRQGLAGPLPGTDLDTLLQGDVGQYPRPT